MTAAMETIVQVVTERLMTNDEFIARVAKVALTNSGEERWPTKPLRDAFIASEVNASEVARRVGWVARGSGRPDSSRVRRYLGIVADKNGAGVRTTVRPDIGRKLLAALGLDPVDVGI